MLRNLGVKETYRSDSGSLLSSFFLPCLNVSTTYYRATGFFSSRLYNIASRQLKRFGEKGGEIRLVTSHNFYPSDYVTITRLCDASSSAGLEMGDGVPQLPSDSDVLLALLKRGTLEIRVADFEDNSGRSGSYHEKFGIFQDDAGDTVVFVGSANETPGGFIGNFEAIQVIRSWIEGTEPASLWLSRFIDLWNGDTDRLEVMKLCAAHKQDMLKVLPSNRRSVPENEPVRPSVPDGIVLRNYQQQAVEEWEHCERRGVFEMATGTGKTITALAALVRLLNELDKCVVVIAAPFTHLLEQWEREAGPFGLRTLKAFGSAGPWRDKLADELLNLSSGFVDHVVVLTTHNTASSQGFSEIVRSISSSKALIVDEVHGIGSPERRKALLEIYDFRLGLSATPQRWFDEEGTQHITEFFGPPVFEFSLAEAIPTYLTPYKYYPKFVNLTEDEQHEYRNLTRKLARMPRDGDDDTEQILRLLRIKRAQVAASAERKYGVLDNLLQQLGDIRHLLVYCSPEQIDTVQAILNKHGVIQHRFTGEEDLAERAHLLDSFAAGHHYALVAMKCLDEGVDVPPTRTAILMASSQNPAQFIQRRGRVLRRHPGKDYAEIYDVIVLPSEKPEDDRVSELEQRILRTELRRFHEFAEVSMNQIEALNSIGPVEREFGVILEEDV